MSDGLDKLICQHRTGEASLALVELHLREGDWAAAALVLDEAGRLLHDNLRTEEERLFPALAEAGRTAGGIIALMRHDHGRVRTLFAAVREWLALRDANAAAAELHSLCQLFHEHNAREEFVLYPLCRLRVPNLNSILAVPAYDA